MVEVIWLDFTFEDKNLVSIIQEVAAITDCNYCGLPDEERREKERERRQYVDSLVKSYIEEYRITHNNRLPSNSIFGEAINDYVKSNYRRTAKRMRTLLRELILGSLERYGKQVRQSYRPKNHANLGSL